LTAGFSLRILHGAGFAADLHKLSASFFHGFQHRWFQVNGGVLEWYTHRREAKAEIEGKQRFKPAGSVLLSHVRGWPAAKDCLSAARPPARSNGAPSRQQLVQQLGGRRRSEGLRRWWVYR
jgi:hypothetical protein